MAFSRLSKERWILWSAVILLLATTRSSADICLLKGASVSQIQGQAKYGQEALAGIPVQLWKSDRKGAKVSLIKDSDTNSAGNFSFSGIPSGWYRLSFLLPGFDGDDFLIHLEGRNLFRWFPSNWLQVGLGIPSMHCPATSLQATRQKAVSADLIASPNQTSKE